MALDPSIPLQAKGIDVAGGAAKFLQLDEMAQGIAMQRYQMQQAMDNERKRRAIAQLYSSPGAYDEKGLPSLKTIQQVFAIDPNAGEKVMNMRSTLETREEQRQKMMTDEAGKRKGLRLEYAQFYKSAYDDFLDKNPNNTEGAKNFARQQYMGKADRDQKSGAVPWMTDQLWKNFLQNSPNDPAAYEAEIKAGQGAREFTQDMDSKALAKRLSDMEKGGSSEPGKDSTIETGFDAQGNPYVKKDQGGVALSQVGQQDPGTQDPANQAALDDLIEQKTGDKNPDRPPVTQPPPPEESTNIEAPAVQMEGKRAESKQDQLERLQRRRDNAAKMGGTAGDKEVKRVEAQIKDLQTDIQKDTSVDQKERFHEDQMKFNQQKLAFYKEKFEKTNSPLPDDALDFITKMALGGNMSGISGFARNQVVKNQIATRLSSMGREMGMSPTDVNAKVAEFRGLEAATKTAAVQGAKIDIGIEELKQFIPQASQAIDKVTRTGWRPLNSVIQAGENTWSPEQRQLVAANRSVINSFAAISSRTGNATVHSVQEAEKMLNTADSPAMYKATLQMLMREADAALRATGNVRKNITGEISGKAPAQDMTGKPGGSPVIKWNDLK